MALVARSSRNQETRGANKRPENWTPPNAMPKQIDLGPGWRARWIRRFYNGAEEDKTSYFKRLRRGWVPVKPEEVPELEYLVDTQTGLVQCDGCILCKIDAAIAEADVQYYEEQAAGALASAKQEYTKDFDRRMTKFSEGGRKVLRGKEPTE